MKNSDSLAPPQKFVKSCLNTKNNPINYTKVLVKTFSIKHINHLNSWNICKSAKTLSTSIWFSRSFPNVSYNSFSGFKLQFTCTCVDMFNFSAESMKNDPPITDIGDNQNFVDINFRGFTKISVSIIHKYVGNDPIYTLGY